MRLAFNDEELAFQKEVRDWLAANMPPEVAEESRRSRTSHVSKERLLQWQKKLASRGWLCPNWPKEYGGPGWNSTQKFIFEMEMARADSPYLSSFSIKMVAPVLMKYGSPAQKQRFLPKIAAAEELWCQGYSEPGSGSDLASLRTKAERRKDEKGDHYLVNGQKIWTTNAHYADWIFCLVRTSNEGKRQEGISFLLIDMKSPGIKIDPIYLVDGTRTPMRHEVNQVFFTDVRVPVENLVGEENKGLDLRQVSAGVRARRPGFRATPAQGVPPSADAVQEPARRRRATVGQRQVAREDGGPGDRDRRRRDERDDVLFRPEDRRRAGQHGLGGQDARHRGRPEGDRARRRGGRLVRRAVHRTAQLRQQHRPRRRRLRRRCLAALLQHPQDHDLWRVVGSAAQRAG